MTAGKAAAEVATTAGEAEAARADAAGIGDACAFGFGAAEAAAWLERVGLAAGFAAAADGLAVAAGAELWLALAGPVAARGAAVATGPDAGAEVGGCDWANCPQPLIRSTQNTQVESSLACSTAG